MTELVFKRCHVLEAIAKARCKDDQWLYDNFPKPDGRPTKSRTVFLLFDDQCFPVKPLGRFANEIAGHPMQSNMNVSKFRARLQKLGFKIVDKPTPPVQREKPCESENPHSKQCACSCATP